MDRHSYLRDPYSWCARVRPSAEARNAGSLWPRRVGFNKEFALKDLQPHALNILFRANHNAMWELADKAGILGEMNLGALGDLRQHLAFGKPMGALHLG